MGAAIAKASKEQVEAAMARARSLRDKWRDLHGDQTRSTKRSAKAGTAVNQRTKAKHDVFDGAVKRFEERLAEFAAGVRAAVGGKPSRLTAAAKPTKAARTKSAREGRASVRSELKEAVAEFTTIRHSWGVALAEREMKAFGATHGHISSLWADKLGLPTTIVQAHFESMMPIGLHSTPLAGVVQLAATMAGAVAARQSVQQVRTALAGPVADSLGLAAHLASGEFEDAYGELHSLTGLQ
jgi:hypothetical protein